jgi:hypothetical protein
MKATLESTSKIVQVNGVPARIWEGKTESGIPFTAFVTRVMVSRNQDNSQFETELRETKAPSAESEAIPLRMVL